MTPVEELREAARVLRERASAATKGPWVVNHDDMWSVVESKSPDIEWNHQREITTIHTADDEWPNNVYIATVHPLVGLALADLLESVESVYGEDFNTVAAQPGHPLGPQLLALSRRILGGGS